MKTRYNFTLSAEVRAKLVALAQAENRTLSNWIESVVLSEFAKKKLVIRDRKNIS